MYNGLSNDEVCYTCRHYESGYCDRYRTYVDDDDSCRNYDYGSNYGSTSCVFIKVFGVRSKEVAIFRRFRDERLKSHSIGRIIIACYSKISPFLMKLFVNSRIFRSIMRHIFSPVAIWLEKRCYKNEKCSFCACKGCEANA